MENYIAERLAKQSEQNIPEIIVADPLGSRERRIPEIVVQDAIEMTGFGKFNWKITFTGFLIYTNVTINIFSVGYILPSAVCDFEMTTVYKGHLAMAPIAGTCLGSLCWEFFIKSKGSRLSLIYALLLHGFIEMCLSLFVSNYWIFVFLKIISGFAAMGEISAVFSFVGDFQPKKERKLIFACLSFVLVFALILLPLMAWAIIPLRFEIRNDYFFFGSWKLFILLTALPAEILGIWLMYYIPESPKFLAKIGHNKELLIVLTQMYRENCGGTSEEYIMYLLKSGNVALMDLVNRGQGYSCYRKTTKKEQIKIIFNDAKLQGEDTIKAPYLGRLIILSFSMFCVSSATYSLYTWFPEILHRYSQFEALNLTDKIDDCSISKIPQTDFKKVSNCKQTIDTSVYQISFLMGISAIFPNLLYLLLVDKFGYRIFAAMFFSMGFLSTICLFFANSFIQNIILACIFKAVMCCTIGILFQFNDELFPENIRIFTSSVSTFCSRIGTIFGNGLFAFLIDNHCSLLIGIVAFQLLLAIVLSVCLRV